MLYNFLQMPRSEIQSLFIDLHERKVELEHQIIELKMSNEKFVERIDGLEEHNSDLEEATHAMEKEIRRLTPLAEQAESRIKATQEILED